jgi:hypothetical protein
VYDFGPGSPANFAYITLDGIAPVGAWEIGSFGMDAGLSDQVAIPSGTLRKWWVLFTEQIRWKELTPYWRATIVLLPLPAPFGGTGVFSLDSLIGPGAGNAFGFDTLILHRTRLVIFRFDTVLPFPSPGGSSFFLDSLLGAISISLPFRVDSNLHSTLPGNSLALDSFLGVAWESAQLGVDSMLLGSIPGNSLALDSFLGGSATPTDTFSLDSYLISRGILTFDASDLQSCQQTSPITPAVNTAFTISARIRTSVLPSVSCAVLFNSYGANLFIEPSGAVHFGTGTSDVYGTAVVTDGAWHTVFLWCDGSNIRIRIGTAWDGLSVSSYNNWLNGYTNFGDQDYTGQLRDVRNYTYALSTAEMDAIALGDENTAVGSPAAWWKCNEGSGTLLADFTGNGFDITFPFSHFPTWT